MGNWGCNPYKYPINGGITLLITGRGPSCREHSVAPLPSCPCQLPHAKRRHADLPQCQQSAIQQQHRDAPAVAMKKLNTCLIYDMHFVGINFGNHNEKIQLSFRHVVKSPARMCARWRDVTDPVGDLWARYGNGNNLFQRTGDGNVIPIFIHFFPESRTCSAAISNGLCPFSVILSGEARSWQQGQSQLAPAVYIPRKWNLKTYPPLSLNTVLFNPYVLGKGPLVKDWSTNCGLFGHGCCSTHQSQTVGLW